MYLPILTQREEEVFELYKSGLTQKQVAKALSEKYNLKISQGNISRVLERVGFKIGFENVWKYKKNTDYSFKGLIERMKA